MNGAPPPTLYPVPFTHLWNKHAVCLSGRRPAGFYRPEPLQERRRMEENQNPEQRTDNTVKKEESGSPSVASDTQVSFHDSRVRISSCCWRESRGKNNENTSRLCVHGVFRPFPRVSPPKYVADHFLQLGATCINLCVDSWLKLCVRTMPEICIRIRFVRYIKLCVEWFCFINLNHWGTDVCTTRRD